MADKAPYVNPAHTADYVRCCHRTTHSTEEPYEGCCHGHAAEEERQPWPYEPEQSDGQADG